MPERLNPYRGRRFPREVIALAVRWYLRFALSFQNVEDLLAGLYHGLCHISDERASFLQSS